MGTAYACLKVGIRPVCLAVSGKERKQDDLGLLNLSPWLGCGADYGGGEYWGTILKAKGLGDSPGKKVGAADGALGGIPGRTN